MADCSTPVIAVRFHKTRVRKHAEVSVPRPVAESEIEGAVLAYHNNSKVASSSHRAPRARRALTRAPSVPGRMRTTRTSSR